MNALGNRSLRNSVIALLITAVALGFTPLLPAQSAVQPGDPSRVASINPFILLFGYFSGEYEQRVSPTLALALAGSYIKFDENNYTNVDAKARLYPNEKALQGFGLGASLGFTRLTDRVFDDRCFIDPAFCERTIRKTYSSPSVAIEITYQWLLGTRKSTAITAGGGAKRFLASSSSFGGNTMIIPTGRISIGYAF